MIKFMNLFFAFSGVILITLITSLFAMARPMNVNVEGEYNAYFIGGSGTEGDPYQISNVYELQNMKLDISAHYILVDDIDASDTWTWNNDGSNGYLGFEPIGTSTSKFTGVFNGNGYKITDLYINRPSAYYIGLFGYTSNSEIKNVYLENVEVNGHSFVGGLVGVNYLGTIVNSYMAGIVRGSSTVGGLAGMNQDGPISNSYLIGSVIGNSEVGGLVGNNANGPVLNSCAAGSVVGSYIVGGLVGLHEDGPILNSYATDSVVGNSKVGGLVGWDENGSISNSYATGSVVGNSKVGGLIGYNLQGNISNSYAAGSVSGDSEVGGLIGVEYFGSTSNSYWNTETSGQSSSAGGTSKTTAEMMQRETYVDWDFVTIWGIEEGKSYPYLRWSMPASPEELIGEVIFRIQKMNLYYGIENALLAKLNAALVYLKVEQYQEAIDVLGAFINICEAQGGKKLAEAQADELIAAVQWIIDSIEGSE